MRDFPDACAVPFAGTRPFADRQKTDRFLQFKWCRRAALATVTVKICERFRMNNTPANAVAYFSSTTGSSTAVCSPGW